MEKVLTVSIAAYNVERYIAAALDSCVVPNMHALEVIVVDDGSTDGTAATALGYEREYPGTFKVIRKRNGGYGSTVNAALAIARGRYFKLLDGDDLFSPKALEDHIEILKGCTADMVLTPHEEVRDGETLETAKVNDQAPEIFGYASQFVNLAIPGLISMHSLTYRTQLLRNIGLKLTENCFYTDAEYATLPLPEIESAYVSHAPLYRYRIGRDGQSMSRSGVIRHYKDHEKVLWRLVESMGEYMEEQAPLPDCFIRRIVHEVAVHYHFLCLLPCSGDVKREMIRFDEDVFLKAPSVLLEAEAGSSRVRLLRRSRFTLYRLAALHAAMVANK